MAVVFDKLDMVKALKDEVPNYGCQPDDEGRIPLELAFSKCNARIVKKLLEFGCLKGCTVSDKR